MFCSIKDHQKSYKFCLSCYNQKKPAKQVFYCALCHSSIKKIHAPHFQKVESIGVNYFMNSLKHIKDIMNTQIRQIQRSQDINIKQLVSDTKLFFYKLLQTDKFKQEIIINQPFMTWLIKININFLQVTKQKQLSRIKKIIIGYLRDQLSVKQKQVEFNQKFQQSEFKIQWNHVQQTNIDQQLQSLKKLKVKTIEQIKISNFVSESFSLFNNDNNLIEQSLKKCNQLIKKYPLSKILYLAKIRMFELLPNKNKQIIPVLNQIISFQKQFQQTDIYYYFKSMSYWQMLDQQRLIKQDQFKVFLQLKNKKYYKLTNSTQYINDLKKAINIQSKSVYHINLAAGYMVENKFQKALEEFQKGMNYQNDSYDLNKIWVHIQKDPHLNLQIISQTVEIRTIQFIVNLCKYFKKNKKYQQLVYFCSVILNKQPDNQKIKIQFAKAIIYLFDSKKTQLDDNDLNKIQKASEIIQQLKSLKNEQAKQLQKALLRMKAKKQMLNEQKIDQAVQKFNLIVNLPNSSSSDYFNYACSLFLNYLKQNDEEILKQSREIINKALQMKSKVKFQKLKFFIECYMNQFNSANKILQSQQKQFINHQAYEQLIEFIKSNID